MDVAKGWFCLELGVKYLGLAIGVMAFFFVIFSIFYYFFAIFSYWISSFWVLYNFGCCFYLIYLIILFRFSLLFFVFLICWMPLRLLFIVLVVRLTFTKHRCYVYSVRYNFLFLHFAIVAQKGHSVKSAQSDEDTFSYLALRYSVFSLSVLNSVWTFSFTLSTPVGCKKDSRSHSHRHSKWLV